MRHMLESALEAARDAELCRLQIERTRPSSPVAERHMARLQRRLEHDEEIASKAEAALFGEGGEALTPTQKDVCFHRYVLGEPWKLVADSTGYCTRFVQKAAEAAFSAIG